MVTVAGIRQKIKGRTRCLFINTRQVECLGERMAHGIDRDQLFRVMGGLLIKGNTMDGVGGYIANGGQDAQVAFIKGGGWTPFFSSRVTHNTPSARSWETSGTMAALRTPLSARARNTSGRHANWACVYLAGSDHLCAQPYTGRNGEAGEGFRLPWLNSMIDFLGDGIQAAGTWRHLHAIFPVIEPG